MMRRLRFPPPRPQGSEFTNAIDVTSPPTSSRRNCLRIRAVRVGISVLPEDISAEDVHHTHDAEGSLSITGGREFELDISDFSARE